MRSTIRYVGLDVHKETIVIGVAEGRGGEPTILTKIGHHWPTLHRVLRRLGPLEKLRCCYEAGPTGYGIYRKLKTVGIRCIVVAPSLIPEHKGNRVKTDRRDAAKLARFLRSGDLTAVYVPDELSEALRDLVRARFDAKRAERVARQQLSHFLLRHGLRYPGKTAWTASYLEWIRYLQFEHEAQKRVLVDYLSAVERGTERIELLERDILELINSWSLFPLVRALQALRGISLIAAATIAVELGDIGRFESAQQLMAYVGLVPSEPSTGDSRRQGRITRTGNDNVRWVVVEAAWSYRFTPKISRDIRKRNEGLSQEVKAIAWKAQQRLHRKYVRLVVRGKNKQQAVTAVARELLGFMWAVSKQSRLLAA